MTAGIKGLRPVREWIQLIEDHNSAFHNRLAEICGGDTRLATQAADMCLRTIKAFADSYGPDDEVLIVRSTGRMNLLGTHVDHRGGSVNPIAVRQIWLVAQPRHDDRVMAKNVESDQFPDEEFYISECLGAGKKIRDWDAWCHDEFEKRTGDPSVTWSSYVRAPTLYFQHLNTTDRGLFTPALKGMNMMFYGDIPRAAGLSSSSSIVMATVEALLRINSIEIEPIDLVEHCGFAEWYVGTRGGYADHAAIRFGKANTILHMTTFPLTVANAPLPSGCRIVLANSMIEAKKQAGARNVFNSRVASYVFGLMMIRRNFPRYAPKLQHLRDVTPDRLGVDEAEVYRILKTLPGSADRREISRLLPEQVDKIHGVFRSHDEPREGYKIRQVCLYGIAECIRSDMVPECLHKGDMKMFGTLINTSHDGDRVTKLDRGKRIPTDNRYPDVRLDSLIEDLQSGDNDRIRRARLWRQPGGYNASVPEMDMLVDIALATPGVFGAGLVGAGMGGGIAVVVEEKHARQLVDNMTDQYYNPRKLPVEITHVRSVDGLCTIVV